MQMKCFLSEANARRWGLLPFNIGIHQMMVNIFSVHEPVTAQLLNPVPISIPIPSILTGISIVVSIVVMTSTVTAASSVVAREYVGSTVVHINVLYLSA